MSDMEEIIERALDEHERLQAKAPNESALQQRENLKATLEINLTQAGYGRVDRALKDAFLAGFSASAEGWNGEYPFDEDEGAILKDVVPMAERYVSRVMGEMEDAPRDEPEGGRDANWVGATLDRAAQAVTELSEPDRKWAVPFKAETKLKSGVVIRKGAPASDAAGRWQPIETAPKDGTELLVGERYKWVPYKPGSPKELRGKGRWMVRNEYGRWERAQNAPSHWAPAPEEE